MLPLILSLAALPLAVQAQGTPGFVSFPLKGSSGAPLVRDIGKRQSDSVLDNELSGTIYTIDITVGTPGQTVAVQFDTGSGETWINPVCSKSFNPQLCEEAGHFTESTTFVNLGVEGGVQYGIGYVDFVYGQDVVKIGDVNLVQQIVGVAYDSESVPVGILGAGPDLYGWNSPYPFVLDNMVYQGWINSRAFGLDLRGIEESTGSVVFGGVDVAKFSGPLQKLPIVPAEESPDGFTRYWVNLDGLTVTNAEGQDVTVLAGDSQTMLLDSGYTLSGFPPAIFQSLLEAFPDAIAIPGSNQYSVDCALVDTEGYLEFTFGAMKIQVPFADFIWQQSGSCYLGAFEESGTPVLGDTFLRAAYVVYDWDNRNIYIANNEDCGTELVAIEAGVDKIDSITGICSPSGQPTTSSSSLIPTSTSQSSTVASSTLVSTSSAPIPTTSSLSTSSSVTSESSSSIVTTSTSSAITTSAVTTSTASSNTTTSSATSVTSASSSSSSIVSVSSFFTNSTTSSPATSSSSTASSSAETSSSASTAASSSHGTASTTAPPGDHTSTITGTTTYTITSCPPTVTHCPVGSVTTETFTTYPTTSSPVYSPSTSTATTTTVYTVTSCPANVPNCPVGHVTTEVITSYTNVCPGITATYTLPNTYTCAHESCHPVDNSTHVVTIFPQPTNPVPVHIPGAPTTTATNIPVVTELPPVVPPPPAFTSVTVTQAPSHSAPSHSVPAVPTGTPIAGAASWGVPRGVVLGLAVLLVALQ